MKSLLIALGIVGTIPLLAAAQYHEAPHAPSRSVIKPVGFHIARLLDRNPRTPFRIELALHNLHTSLYDRYVAYRLSRCAGTVTDVSRGS